MTTALEGGEGSASRPDRSLPPEKTWYPLYRGLVGPQVRSGQVRKISPPPGFDLRTVQPVASRCTDYATRPTICTEGSCLIGVRQTHIFFLIPFRYFISLVPCLFFSTVCVVSDSIYSISVRKVLFCFLFTIVHSLPNSYTLRLCLFGPLRNVIGSIEEHFV